MKQTELKRYKGINKVSKRRQEQNKVYFSLIYGLRLDCKNLSELSGKTPVYPPWVDPHHIYGRIGDRYIDPFNIIMLTREEHDIEERKRPGERQGPEKLLSLVYWIRIKQGFTKEAK